MKTKIILLGVLIVSVLFLSQGVFAYETYEISEEDLEVNYTKDLSPGDRINFPVGGEVGYISVSAVYVNAAVFYVFANGRQEFTGIEHPDYSEVFTNEKKFEMTGDNYYDLKVTLNNATIGENDSRVASIILEKISEEIPGSPEVNSPNTGGVGEAIPIPVTVYSNNDTCEKYFTCPNGLEVQYCEIVEQYDNNGNVVGAGCGCKSNPEELCINFSSGGGGGPGVVNSSFEDLNCNGCILEDSCVPIGYRAGNKYCGLEGELIGQLNAQEFCENNFECSTNLCIDSRCVSSGVWQKLLRWFSKVF